MKIKINFLSILLCILTLSCQSCSNPTTIKQKKELLIYCGITLIQPIREIADIIEIQEDCKITISKDGSGNLLKSIRINKVGDLFIPGSESYIKAAQKDGLVDKSTLVGYMKAAIFVQKGNPKNIPADLLSLANPNYFVIIGNPETGSIGKETKKILQKKQIFDEVLKNSKQLTTDSKDITKAIKEKIADIGINWYAISTWVDNINYIETLPIKDDYAIKKKLMIGKLVNSEHPDICQKFMEFASSLKGRIIFQKYGL